LHWKLLKPYGEADSKATMPLIQCPHCGEDIELEDGVSGLFDCPYCDKDFTWDGKVKVIVVDDDLISKFLVFLFGIFSPSLLFFVSLWIQIAVFPPSGWDVLLYFLISIGICVVYTLSLAIYSGLTKNKPLLQGIFLSLVASCLVIFMYADAM
jgi:hypothetical protein